MTTSQAPLSPRVFVGVGGGLGGGCIGRAPCYPFIPRWGNACGSTYVPHWDSGHCVGSGKMPKSVALPTLIWEARV
jgi:hypothetical protein